MAERFCIRKRKQGLFRKSLFTHGVHDTTIRGGALICIAPEHSAQLVADTMNIATTPHGDDRNQLLKSIRARDED